MFEWTVYGDQIMDAFILSLRNRHMIIWNFIQLHDL